MASGDFVLLVVAGGDLGGLSGDRFCSGLRPIVESKASSEKSEPLPGDIVRPAVFAFLKVNRDLVPGGLIHPMFSWNTYLSSFALNVEAFVSLVD